eukprot:10139421-Ditylum_brightwellii.AAC.1
MEYATLMKLTLNKYTTPKGQNLRLKNNNQKKPAAPKSKKSNPSNNKNKKRTKPKKQDSGILGTYYWYPAHNAWTNNNLDPNYPDGFKKVMQQQQARAASHPRFQQGTSMRAMASVFDAAVADDKGEECLHCRARRLVVNTIYRTITCTIHYISFVPYVALILFIDMALLPITTLSIIMMVLCPSIHLNNVMMYISWLKSQIKTEQEELNIIATTKCKEGPNTQDHANATML